MAASGEPYSVAARGIAGAQPALGAAGIGEVIARATATMAAPSARIEIRFDRDIVVAERPWWREAGLTRLARRAAWKAIAATRTVAQLRETFLHPAAVGFIEPAAGRYMVDFGSYANMRVDGQRFAGLSGQPLQPRYRDHRPPEQLDDPLELLTQVRDATEAADAGEEAVRGTPCQVVAVRAGPTELTVWIDDTHIRRMRSVEHASGAAASVSKTLTIELWDFGVAVGSLDWSRLPSFRSR
jgi:hypothetical protein